MSASIDAIATTPWLDSRARPARVGVYARRPPAGPFACWDGSRWRSDADSPEEAACATGASRWKTAAWRGLATPSAAPCATCRGHTVIDRGVELESGRDLIEECPDC